MELHAAYRELIIPALAAIGSMWEAGDIDVSEEHAGSQVAGRIVARLGPRVARRGVKRGIIVLGSTSTELHSLPLSIAADLLRVGRYDVVDLGANLPPRSFARGVAAVEDVIAVGIGVTTTGQEEELAATVSAVRATKDLPVVIGGGGVTEDQALELGADGWARTGDDAVVVFDRLLRR